METIDGIEVVRSRRKTVALTMKRDGTPLIRAPKGVPRAFIRQFLRQHPEWLEHCEQKKQALEAAGRYSEEEMKAMAAKAREIIPERCRFRAGQMGVEYNRIALRFQHTRWGSCSGKKNLNFNCLLVQAPPEVLDSVVVHELCHLKEMNHSRAFYENVYRYCPEYDRCSRWLKEHGAELLAKLPG